MIYFPTTLASNSRSNNISSAAKENFIAFQGFPYGENTAVSPFQLTIKDLAACIDFKLNPGGQLESRAPIVKFTDTAIGTPTDVKRCSLSGVYYTLAVDSTKVYYFDGVTPTEIGTVANAASITPYNDVALISDGSYLKFCEDTSEVKMAYDAGSGGTFYDNYSGIDDTTIDSAKVAVKFTTPTWDAGFTIPPTKIYFKAKSSSGDQTITVKVYKVSDDTVMATKVCDTLLSETATILNVAFDLASVTELEPSTDYYASVEATNLQMSATTVASGGVGYTNSGSWAAVTTKNPVMRVHPGLPPKSTFCTVSGNRPMLKNPDEPGRVYFGNLTHLDWSTTDGGGWVGVIDDGANSFEIGGMEDLYGTLYVYGTEDTPYLCQLQGDSPDTYSLPLMFQKIWTTQRTLVNTNNDLWNSSSAGVDALSGVQEYGDLRTLSASDPIKDRFFNWASTTAFSGYNAVDGQYWLYMPEYDYISVCHTKQGVANEDGKTVYPWARYKFPITPSCFSQTGSDFLIGSTDGYFYTFTSSSSKDLDTSYIYPEFKTAYMQLPGKTTDLIQFQAAVSSTVCASMSIDFYKNTSATALLTKPLSLPLLDTVTIADLAGLSIADLASIPIASGGKPLYFNININCFSFQLGISNLKTFGRPVYISGVTLKYRELEA